MSNKLRKNSCLTQKNNLVILFTLFLLISGCNATENGTKKDSNIDKPSADKITNKTTESNDIKTEEENNFYPQKKGKNVELEFEKKYTTQLTNQNIDLSTFKGWLTFDDGPHPKTTPYLIKQLQDAKVKNVIFFFLGQRIIEYPELVRLVDKAGFEIGYHSMHHINQASLTTTEISNDIKEFKRALSTALGKEYGLKHGRPPYGGMTNKTVKTFYTLERRGELTKIPLAPSTSAKTFNANIVNNKIISAFKEHYMHLWLWNIDFDDWEKTIAEGLEHARNSYIPNMEQVWLFHEMPIDGRILKIYDNKITQQFHLILNQIKLLQEKYNYENETIQFDHSQPTGQ